MNELDELMTQLGSLQIKALFLLLCLLVYILAVFASVQEQIDQ